MKSLFFCFLIAVISISLSAKEVGKKSKTQKQLDGEYCDKIENQSMNITIQHVPFKIYIDQVDAKTSGCHCVVGVLVLEEKIVKGVSYDAFFKSVKSATPSKVGCGE